MIAVAVGAEPAFVGALLAAGADKTTTHPKTGETALHVARAVAFLGRGNPEANERVVALLEARAGLDVVSLS